MIMAQAISALAPDRIAVPAENDRSSVKLAPLCRANGVPFADDEAHDGLADVKATARLAGVLQAEAPQAFARVLALADKSFAMDLVRREPVLLVLHVASTGPTVRAVTPLGPAPGNPNAITCIDLASDPAEFVNCTMISWRSGCTDHHRPL